MGTFWGHHTGSYAKLTWNSPWKGRQILKPSLWPPQSSHISLCTTPRLIPPGSIYLLLRIASMRTQSIPNCQRGLKSIMHLHICKSPVLLNIKPRNLQKLGKLGTPLRVMLNQSREYILNNQFQRHKSYPLILCSTDSQILPDMWEQTEMGKVFGTNRKDDQLCHKLS